MLISRLLLSAVLCLAPAGVALACADPPRASFRDLVATAPTIFTFQVTSAYYIREPLGDDAHAEYVVGHMKVVDTLKGSASAFRLIKYSFRRCGSTRMSVGRLYLAATYQSGPLLELAGTDWALLDLTLDFYHEDSKRSPAVDVVKSIIGGSPVPDDFPRADLEIPLRVYPVPPPPAPRQ